MKEIHVYTHKNLSTREFAALNLCRNVLEDVRPDYKDRYALSDGEVITFNSAVEVFDNLIERDKE
ncbi:MAG: hypothetical protein IJ167_03430 [Lachnospiraceae bacterium]|nr:hypothetical protein [Lachnospiraceae bacterium]